MRKNPRRSVVLTKDLRGVGEGKKPRREYESAARVRRAVKSRIETDVGGTKKINETGRRGRAAPLQEIDVMEKMRRRIISRE